MRFRSGPSSGKFKGNALAYKFGKQEYAPSEIIFFSRFVCDRASWSFYFRVCYHCFPDTAYHRRFWGKFFCLEQFLREQQPENGHLDSQ